MHGADLPEMDKPFRRGGSLYHAHSMSGTYFAVEPVSLPEVFVLGCQVVCKLIQEKSLTVTLVTVTQYRSIWLQ